MHNALGFGFGLTARAVRVPDRRIDIVFYEESCKACALCIGLCPTDVFDSAKLHAMPVVARIEDCTGCRLCEFLCPDWALSVELVGEA